MAINLDGITLINNFTISISALPFLIERSDFLFIQISMSLSSIENGLRISWGPYRCVTHKACLVASLKHATLIGYERTTL